VSHSRCHLCDHKHATACPGSQPTCCTVVRGHSHSPEHVIKLGGGFKWQADAAQQTTWHEYTWTCISSAPAWCLPSLTCLRRCCPGERHSLPRLFVTQTAAVDFAAFTNLRMHPQPCRQIQQVVACIISPHSTTLTHMAAVEPCKPAL
jgi:hypothetical protein